MHSVLVGFVYRYDCQNIYQIYIFISAFFFFSFFFFTYGSLFETCVTTWACVFVCMYVHVSVVSIFDIISHFVRAGFYDVLYITQHPTYFFFFFCRCFFFLSKMRKGNAFACIQFSLCPVVNFNFVFFFHPYSSLFLSIVLCWSWKCVRCAKQHQQSAHDSMMPSLVCFVLYLVYMLEYRCSKIAVSSNAWNGKGMDAFNVSIAHGNGVGIRQCHRCHSIACDTCCFYGLYFSFGASLISPVQFGIGAVRFSCVQFLEHSCVFVITGECLATAKSCIHTLPKMKTE